MVDGKKDWKWVERPVTGLESGRYPDLRCVHCRGAVTVHIQKVSNGPADHVEHQRREDSENCRGGSYFKGTHKVSQFPVE
jgi:hypothetical protein